MTILLLLAAIPLSSQESFDELIRLLSDDAIEVREEAAGKLLAHVGEAPFR